MLTNEEFIKSLTSNDLERFFQINTKSLPASSFLKKITRKLLDIFPNSDYSLIETSVIASRNQEASPKEYTLYDEDAKALIAIKSNEELSYSLFEKILDTLIQKQGDAVYTLGIQTLLDFFSHQDTLFLTENFASAYYDLIVKHLAPLNKYSLRSPSFRDITITSIKPSIGKVFWVEDSIKASSCDTHFIGTTGTQPSKPNQSIGIDFAKIALRWYNLYQCILDLVPSILNTFEIEESEAERIVEGLLQDVIAEAKKDPEHTFIPEVFSATSSSTSATLHTQF